jgi:RNA-directed DNA polymerase
VTDLHPLLVELRARFEACGLEMHPDKTKIIYCKDANRKGNYPDTQFDFLGYTFRRRTAENNKTHVRFVSFVPAVSQKSLNSMREKTRTRRFGRRTEVELEDIARMYNPVLNGWINYYGQYHKSGLYPMAQHFNKILATWVRRKYKRFKGSKVKSGQFLWNVFKKNPGLFAHWKLGSTGAFA